MNRIFLVGLIWVSTFQISSASWSQVASMPSYGRALSNAFVINGMAYMGGGFDSVHVYHDDFWQFNPFTNMWTQKANLPVVNAGASCFTVGNKGYMVNGWINAMNSNGVYEYDATTNSWTTKHVFPGAGRYHSAEFVIGNLAYVGLGYSPMMDDFWVYDASSDTWSQIASFPGGAREAPVSFSINGIGYVGTGTNDPNTLSGLGDFYSYNPSTNIWTQIGNFGGAPRHSAISFVYRGKGYVGTGGDGGVSGQFFNDFYEFDPINQTWTLIDSLPSDRRANGCTFTIDECGYIYGGVHFISSINYTFRDVWRYCAPANGIDEYNSQSIKIYINSDNRTVEIKCGDYIVKSGKIQIYDMLGKCILTSTVKVQDLEVPIENFAAGIYSYQFTDDDQLIKSGKIKL